MRLLEVLEFWYIYAGEDTGCCTSSSNIVSESIQSEQKSILLSTFTTPVHCDLKHQLEAPKRSICSVPGSDEASNVVQHYTAPQTGHYLRLLVPFFPQELY